MIGKKASIVNSLAGIACLCASAALAQPCQTALIQAEMATLSQAMEIAYLDTNYYHTIEDLNDQATANPTFFFDDINEAGLGTAVLMPSTGRFRTTRANLVSPLRWRGAYVNYQQGRIDTLSSYDPGTLLDLAGTGQPYHLYSPLGLVEPTSESISLAFHGDRFDRWTLVSAGCDGVFVTGDDIFYSLGPGIGGAPTIPVISSVQPLSLANSAPRSIRASSGADDPPALQPGETILVRGYQFGGTQGTSRLLLDGQDMGAAQLWNSQRIEIVLPQGLTGSQIQLEIGGTIRDSREVRVTSSVSKWILFE